MKVFGKYDTEDVEIRDASLRQVISFSPSPIPHTFGRHAGSYNAKIKVNVVERLINKLMRGGTGEKTSGKVIRTHGRLQGKKMKLIKVVEKAFEEIEKKTGKNPVQILVNAIENAAPLEDVTRVTYGGVRYQVAVDIAAKRRLDLALRNITLASLMKAFNKPTPLFVVLAEEIINTANGDVQNSYAIKKKNEIERMARSAR